MAAGKNSDVDKKTLTLLMISNRRGVVKRMVVSTGLLKALGIVIGVFAIVGATVFVDYLGLLVQSVENKHLRSENTILRNQFKIVETKLKSVEERFDRISSFVTKLRLITNTDDKDQALKLAVGPLPNVQGHTDSHYEEGVDRDPAAHQKYQEDQVFLERPPLDYSRGEIASERGNEFAYLSIRLDQNLRHAKLREQNLMELWEALSSRQSLLQATPSIKPARGWFTSRFGYRLSPYTGRATLHQGLDIAASPGTPVFAPADGVISYAGYDPGYGKLVSIDHGYGLVTRYGHNSQIYVRVGQKISRGDRISAVGNTGRSTGPHLHYEVRLNNVPVDPMNYILVE